MLTVVVDPARAVGVDVSNHVVDVLLGEVVTQVLQDPPASRSHTRRYHHS